MDRWFYEALAGAALALHLLFILWVMFGGLLTRRRPRLAWVHVGSLAYGIVIQVGPWPCPLTLAEQYCRVKAGRAPYEESFIVHYLEALVYPGVPQNLLVGAACAVCVFNLATHLRRWRRRVIP